MSKCAVEFVEQHVHFKACVLHRFVLHYFLFMIMYRV